MKLNFNVEITETISHLVPVQAENYDEAERIVRELYRNGEIVPNENDFVDVQFGRYDYEKFEPIKKPSVGMDYTEGLRKVIEAEKAAETAKKLVKPKKAPTLSR